MAEYIDLRAHKLNIEIDHLYKHEFFQCMKEMTFYDILNEYNDDNIYEIMEEEVDEHCSFIAYEQLKQWMFNDHDKFVEYMNIINRDHVEYPNYQMMVKLAYTVYCQDIRREKMKYIIRYFMLQYMIDHLYSVTFEQLIEMYDQTRDLTSFNQIIDVIDNVMQRPKSLTELMK